MKNAWIKFWLCVFQFARRRFVSELRLLVRRVEKDGSVFVRLDGEEFRRMDHSGIVEGNILNASSSRILTVAQVYYGEALCYPWEGAHFKVGEKVIRRGGVPGNFPAF